MITPYAAAKIANIVLASKNIDATIKPQMLYTYAKKSMIPSFIGEDNKIYFEDSDFKAFLDRYIAKQLNKSTASYEELAKNFM
jgi:hypothetical protein